MRGDELARRLIGELALGVELVLSLWDHHLGPVHHQSVQEHEALPQMMLRPPGAENTGARTHQPDRLTVEWLLRRARGPVDRVLQHAGNRVVVLWCHEQ